ncbi:MULTISPECIES: trypco2 family protein [unclassified Streptomyces]|uniref:trypco2 family protein n=1 Tax=unclassified Streptomyces TaxID=2593676 RepID=UPI0033C7CD41
MIELAEMIAQLRGELAAAMAAAENAENAENAEDTALRFELGPVQLEAEFAVQRSAGADGRIRFWVVEAGASGQQATSTTHRVTLSLEPRVRGSDQRPWVSGDQAARER